MNLQIKNYNNGDMKKILSLFKDTFNRELSEEYWIWRYQENLIKEKYIKLMWDQGLLAGHYALFPVELKAGSDIKKTGYSMTTMVSSQYRKLGIFNDLANSLYDDTNGSLEFIWGFPNNNSLHGFVKYLEWQLVTDIPMLEVNIDSFKGVETNINVINIDIFSNDYDVFFELVSQNYNIIVKRDSKYLNWRYINNPDNRYYVFEYRERDQLLGYCVYKLYQNDETLNGYIVDILSLNDTVFVSLITKSINELKQLGAIKAFIWMNDYDHLINLKGLGFQSNDRTTHFACRLDSDKTLDINILDFSNWYLMMGDSDVF